MNSNLSTKLSVATATICFLGAFAAAATAGPSTQFFTRTAAPAKTDPAAAVGCPSCQTTDLRVATSHGPAGKSTTEWTTVGTRHECARCQGAVATTNGSTKDDMVRDALKCGAMVCCVTK